MSSAQLLESARNDSERDSAIGASVDPRSPLLEPRRTKTGRVWVVLVYALIAGFGGVIGGYSHGFPSPTLLDLQQAYEKGERTTAFSSNGATAGVFGAIGPIGALCGGCMAGPVSDRLGRAVALVIMNIPHLIGWLGQAYAHWIPTREGFIATLMFGRYLTGFGTGWGSLVISVYIVEISPSRLKGLFGSFYWLSTSIGILLVYTLGAIPGFSYYNLSLSTAALVLPCILLNCLLPETPRWLVTHRRNVDALRILQRLRGPVTNISTEMAELQTTVAQSRRVSFFESFALLKRRSTFVPLVLSVILMFFQQFTGTNVVLFYAGTILTEAHVKNAQQVAGYAIGATQVVATFLSVLLVDVVGRKVLLTFSGVVVSMSTGVLGLYYFLTDYVCHHIHHASAMNLSVVGSTGQPSFCDPVGSNFYYLAICCVMLFIVAFSIGWATVPWVMMSELSPLQTRGLLSGFATTANWSFAAILTGTFPMYKGVVHPYGAWWTLSGITLLGVPFVLRFIPETRGRSLEQIEQSIRTHAASSSSDESKT